MNFGANDLKDDISISIVLLKKTNGVYLSVKCAFIFCYCLLSEFTQDQRRIHLNLERENKVGASDKLYSRTPEEKEDKNHLGR